MAEVFGVVASGIAVAQVAGTAAGAVLKLRRLWEEVKNVPETVADLMEQIDCLDPALWEAEQNFIHNQLPPQLWDDTAAIRSATYCRKALQKLSDVADDLATQINSDRKFQRGVSRVKVLLKKDRLRNLEQRLESAVRMLQLAQQGYLITLIKLQPEVVAHKVNAQLENGRRLNSLTSTDPEMDNKDAKCGNDLVRPMPWRVDVKRFPREKKSLTRKGHSLLGYANFVSTPRGFFVDTQPPSWLMGILRVWSFSVAKSYSSWKFHLRSYLVRPLESSIFRVVRDDDVQRLQEMFASGEASPFDRDPGGSGILHYSVQMTSVKVLRLIKGMNLDIDGPNARNYVAIDWLRWYQWYDLSHLNRILEFIQLISPESFIIRDHEDCRRRCRCPAVSDAEVFRKLQPITCPAHSETPLNSRLHIAGSIRYLLPRLETEVFQRILSPDFTQDFDALCTYDGYHMRLIHIITLIVPRFDVSLSEGGNCREVKIQSWIDLARDVLLRSNIHSLSEQKTPLICLLLSRFCWSGHNWNNFKKLIQTKLRNWLILLKTTGTDLITYGREEARILLTIDAEYRTRCAWNYIRNKYASRRDCWMGRYTLTGLQFGPNVDDWNTLWSEPTDEFVGDFWNMIEDPALHIPGAWY